VYVRLSSLTGRATKDVSLERPTYAADLKEGKFYAKLTDGGRRVWAVLLAASSRHELAT
jgi:hypothetical protein